MKFLPCLVAAIFTIGSTAFANESERNSALTTDASHIPSAVIVDHACFISSSTQTYANCYLESEKDGQVRLLTTLEASSELLQSKAFALSGYDIIVISANEYATLSDGHPPTTLALIDEAGETFLSASGGFDNKCMNNGNLVNCGDFSESNGGGKTANPDEGGGRRETCHAACDIGGVAAGALLDAALSKAPGRLGQITVGITGHGAIGGFVNQCKRACDK